MYVVRADNFDALRTYRFVDDKVALFPTKLIRQIDDTRSLKVCNDPERSYNVWTGKDWKEVGILYVWSKNGDRCYGTNRADEVKPYIQDLIDDGIVDLKDE